MKKQELEAQGYRQYAGQDIDVYYSIDICQHAGECVRGSIDVFNPKRKPWIIADAKPAQEVADIIERCPTKALRYVMGEER